MEARNNTEIFDIRDSPFLWHIKTLLVKNFSAITIFSVFQNDYCKNILCGIWRTLRLFFGILLVVINFTIIFEVQIDKTQWYRGERGGLI